MSVRVLFGNESLNSVVFPPDGKTLAAASGNTIKIYRMPSQHSINPSSPSGESDQYRDLTNRWRVQVGIFAHEESAGGLLKSLFPLSDVGVDI